MKGASLIIPKSPSIGRLSQKKRHKSAEAKTPSRKIILLFFRFKTDFASSDGKVVDFTISEFFNGMRRSFET